MEKLKAIMKAWNWSSGCTLWAEAWLGVLRESRNLGEGSLFRCALRHRSTNISILDGRKLEG